MRGGYFEITVNGARRARKYNDYNTATDGSLYLIVDVTAKCIGTESRLLIEGSAFTAYEGTELEYDDDEYHSEQIGTLNPLIKETGKVIYLVPAELTGPYYWVPGREAGLRFALGTL